jgi:hypothetical protein
VTEQTNFADQFAHFVTCSLLALELAKIEGHCQSSPAEHKFLMAWLQQSIKQKRFPKPVTREAQLLQKLGRSRGQLAQLKKRLTQIFNDYSVAKAKINCAEGSYLRRMFDACALLGTDGWKCKVGLERDWGKEGAVDFEEKTLFCIKEHLEEGFDDDGVLLMPASLFVVGDPQLMIDRFYEKGLQLYSRQRNVYAGKRQEHFEIWPNNKLPGAAANPSAI